MQRLRVKEEFVMAQNFDTHPVVAVMSLVAPVHHGCACDNSFSLASFNLSFVACA